MLLLRCFRVDRVYLAVSQFIAQSPEMGEKYCSPPILKYVDVYKQSTQYSPIVCIIRCATLRVSVNTIVLRGVEVCRQS